MYFVCVCVIIINVFYFKCSNTRRRRSLQSLLHASTFVRRMEKISKGMDPLKPSRSEESILKKLQEKENPTSSAKTQRKFGLLARQTARMARRSSVAVNDKKGEQPKKEVEFDYSFVKSLKRICAIKAFQRKLFEKHKKSLAARDELIKQANTIQEEGSTTINKEVHTKELKKKGRRSLAIVDK